MHFDISIEILYIFHISIVVTGEVVVGCVYYRYEKIKIKEKHLVPWKFPRVPLVQLKGYLK